MLKKIVCLVFGLMLANSLPVRADTVEVVIDKMKFLPAQVKIKVGDSVKWINQEKRNNHSVRFESENLESERFFPGESWSRTFDKAGVYPYICGPHPEMTGQVEVTN
jgi:plastocyanin